MRGGKIVFEYEFDVTIIEKDDCQLISNALKVYEIWAETVKATCRNPVINGIPASDVIKTARELRKEFDGAALATVHAK